jgi:hypothetical protein
VLRRHRELWYSAFAIVVVTLLYLAAYAQRGAFPAASGLVGHGIGTLGFVLMLMAETLYSIRKRVDDARWGSMADWLRFHIVTGLVGPWMVLLHTAMSFRGLAGFALLLTGIVVLSGIAGRYLFTAASRETGSPTAVAGPDALARPRRAFAYWRMAHVPLTWVLFAAALVHVVVALYYATLAR